jgi:hypothetical protein
VRQLLCFCWFTVVFFLLFFYAHNNDTIVSKKEEGKHAHERRRYSLHASSLLFSNHHHRLLGTYHLAFASSNLLVFFPASSFFEDNEEAERLLLLLLNVNEKYTVAAKNAKTTAFPSIAPGGFRTLIASRPSLNAILDLHSSVKSVTHRIRKDVLLLFRLLEYTLSLFLSEEEDAGECCVSSFFARSIVLRSVPVRRWSSKRRRLDDDFTGVVADVTEDDERRRERRKARCYSRVYELQ